MTFSHGHFYNDNYLRLQPTAQLAIFFAKDILLSVPNRELAIEERFKEGLLRPVEISIPMQFKKKLRFKSAKFPSAQISSSAFTTMSGLQAPLWAHGFRRQSAVLKFVNQGCIY